MTGLFDFVSYAAGLGGTKWKAFTPALIISVALSDLPIVALGAGVFNGGKLMLVFASLGVFALAIIAGAVKKYQRKALSKNATRTITISTHHDNKKEPFQKSSTAG